MLLIRYLCLRAVFILPLKCRLCASPQCADFFFLLIQAIVLDVQIGFSFFSHLNIIKRVESNVGNERHFEYMLITQHAERVLNSSKWKLSRQNKRILYWD